MLSTLVVMAIGLDVPELFADPELHFQRLSNRDGLSQMAVYSILQDARGFMWFGTLDGLNRWDGHRFRVLKHRPNDPESLTSGAITALVEDPNGVLWIGTRGGGIDRFDPQSGDIVHYRHAPSDPQSLAHDEIWALHLDRRDGALWIGTWGGGIDRLEPASGTFTHHRPRAEDPASLAHPSVLALLEDRAGQFWIATWGGGLDRFDRRTGVFIHHRHDPVNPRSLPDDYVRTLHEDRAGDLWIGTLGGLARLDRTTGDFTNYRHDPEDPDSLGHDAVFVLREDHAGQLWIGTAGGGLERLDAERRRFTHFRADPSDPHSLSHDFVRALWQDRDNGLWIGTEGGGLNRLDFVRGRFRVFRHDPHDPDSLTENSVRTFWEDREGILWVGTSGGGLDRFDLVSGEVRHHRHDPGDPHSLAEDFVLDVLEDRAGDLWIATLGGGLDRFDRATGRFVHHRHDPEDPASLGADEIFDLYEDRTGDLWIATWGGGIARLGPRRERLVHYRHDPEDPASLSEDRVRVIEEDGHGELWIGTESAGLARLDAARQSFTRYRHDPADRASLSHNHILALTADRAGNLWVGTAGGGLNRLDPARRFFERFTEIDGLPGGFIYGILEDDRDCLWLSSNGGLARFDPQTRRISRYDFRDGLQDNEFNFGAAHRGAGGTFFFGGLRGFNAFRPEDFVDLLAPPPVAITGVRLFGQEIAPRDWRSGLELAHDENFLAFEFAAMSFSRPDLNRYRHRLEGLDPVWVTSGGQSGASYPNLAPGRYVFRVAAANSDGVWSSEDATLAVVVSPPVWRSGAAYAAYVLALVLLVGGSLRFQQNRLRRERTHAARERAVNRRLREADRTKDALIAELETKNAELERFTYTVSHDLKSPLVTIRGFLGYVRRDLAAGERRRTEEDLDRIETAADQMQRLLDDLLELSRIGRVIHPPEEIPTGELIHEAEASLRVQLAERGVELRVASGLPSIRGDRLRLIEVFQNLIENAIKFSAPEGPSRIEIGTRTGAERTIFYVRDEGIGIEARYRDKIFGLFERLDPEIEGTGVGLALVKRIVELHGGEIWVESPERGRGSTFCFTLPVVPPDGSHPAG